MRTVFAVLIVGLALYAWFATQANLSKHYVPETGSSVDSFRAQSGATPSSTPRQYIQPAPAQTVAARFAANEVAGERDYKGKVGTVYGVVTDIGIDIFGSPYLILDGDQPPYGIQCSFGRDQKDALAVLQKGSRVSVQGEFGGKLVHVQMSDCLLQR